MPPKFTLPDFPLPPALKRLSIAEAIYAATKLVSHPSVSFDKITPGSFEDVRQQFEKLLPIDTRAKIMGDIYPGRMTAGHQTLWLIVFLAFLWFILYSRDKAESLTEMIVKKWQEDEDNSN